MSKGRKRKAWIAMANRQRNLACINPRHLFAVSPAPTFVGACRATFGSHPEDVITPINSAAETLMQLHEIFRTISDEAIDAHKAQRIKTLADAGAYLAFDIGNFAGCEFERLRNSLVDAGILNAEDDHE